MGDSTTKRCSKCGDEKPLNDFHKDRTSRSGYAYHCKACANARASQHHTDNRAAHIRYAAEYSKRNRVRQNELKRAYELRNPELTRLRKLAAAKRWQKLHPEEDRAKGHARDARKRGNGGAYTAAEWRIVKARYSHHCLWCGKCEPQIKLTPDHVVPLSWGGSNDISNIQPLCYSCNSRKGDRHATDYRPSWASRFDQLSFDL